MIKFKFEGKDAELDDKTNLLYLDGKIIDPVFVGQEFVAKVNKAIRDTMPKTRKLNIGCGHRPKNDFINLDYDHLVYPDIVRDINEGLPFDSDSIDEIYCSHVIEHIKDIFFFMYEMWRVCKNGSKVTIICPNAYSINWAIQPDHVRLIHLDYFTRWKPEHLSVQNEFKQNRGAKFNILLKESFNDERELKFILEAVK